jgi:hypothetical protein
MPQHKVGVSDLNRVGCFYLLLLLWFLCLPNPAVAADAVTLDRYLDLVKTNNRTLLSNAHAIEAAYYGVLASVSPQRPNMAAGVGTSYLTRQGRGESRRAISRPLTPKSDYRDDSMSAEAIRWTNSSRFCHTKARGRVSTTASTP